MSDRSQNPERLFQQPDEAVAEIVSQVRAIERRVS
jgi:hypothetical protein